MGFDERLHELESIIGAMDLPNDAVKTLLEESVYETEEEALERFFELCARDPTCARIMRQYSATQDTLFELYWELIAYGGGQWIGGRYLPAAALSTPDTLAMCLEARAGRAEGMRRIVNRLVAVFSTPQRLRRYARPGSAAKLARVESAPAPAGDESRARYQQH